MIKTIISLVWGVGLGWSCASWFGSNIGWGIFALGLVIMILVSGLQLSRIAHWVKDIEAPPPPSVGPWDEILAPIYRQLRKDKQDLTELNQHVDGIMLAAEALADGAITLEAAMLLTWCNQTDSEHNGQIGRASCWARVCQYV